MTAGTDKLKAAWRDFAVDGVPASGANEPAKGEIREGLDALAVDLAVAAASGEGAPLEQVQAVVDEGVTEARAWAIADTAPDPDDFPDQKSSKSYAADAGALVQQAANTIAAVQGQVAISVKSWLASTRFLPSTPRRLGLVLAAPPGPVLRRAM